MKQYLTVVVVFLICMIAIIATCIWRVSERTQQSKDDFDDLVNTYVTIYQDQVRIYE